MKRSLWPARDPVRDYYPLPKEIFSLGLNAAEIAIYAYLPVSYTHLTLPTTERV